MSKLSLLHATQTRKKQIIKKVVEDSSPFPKYFLLLILSSIIVTLGLVLNSVAVVIGGMLVSPLLSPILSLGMGIVISDPKLMYRSAYVLLKSMLLVLGIAVVITWISTIDHENNIEIISRAQPSLSYFYIAIASGVAAAFSYIREDFEENLVGVAVAIALLPPISVTGIGIASLNMELIFGSIELFFANLTGILLSAVIVFSLFGFYAVKREAEEQLEEDAKELAKYEKEKEKLKQEIKEELAGEEDKK